VWGAEIRSTWRRAPKVAVALRPAGVTVVSPRRVERPPPDRLGGHACAFVARVPRASLCLAAVAAEPGSEEFKELEIVVLWHEHAVVRRQVARPHVRPADRAFSAAASRLLPRARRRSFFVTQDTLVRWPRRHAQTLDVSASTMRPTRAGEGHPRTGAAPRTREP